MSPKFTPTTGSSLDSDLQAMSGAFEEPLDFNTYVSKLASVFLSHPGYESLAVAGSCIVKTIGATCRDRSA